MTRSRRASLFVGIIVYWLFVTGCGETFRPVVTPIPQPGPDPQGAKNVIVLSRATTGGGIATHIDLSADVNIGEARIGPNPVHAVTISNGTRVAVANQAADSISLYATSNPASQTVVTASLPIGAQPSFVAINRATGNLFVAMSGLNAIGVVASSSALFTNQINLTGSPVAVAVTPDGNKAYSANADGSVAAIDARALNLITNISVGGTPNYIVSSADSAYVYVVNGNGKVHVIKTSDNSLQPDVTVGASPSFAFFDPRLLRVYVPNTGSNTVSIINADANRDPNSPGGFRSVVTVPVGTAPKFVTALADGSKAYVSNSGDNTVSVINTLSNTVVKLIPTEVEGAAGVITTAGIGHDPENIVSSTDSTKVAVLNKGTRLNGKSTVTSIRTTDDQVVQTIELPSTVPLSSGNALTPVYMISQQ